MKNTKDLTVGAMFGAIYGIILIGVRYLFASTDSLIYYFIPLPLAIFTFWRGFKNGSVLFIVVSLLSFLICDPLRVLFLLIPNFLIGLLFGLFEKKSKGITLIITFVVALLANFLSIYAFELITGISYFASTVEEMNFLTNSFSTIDEMLIYNIVYVVIPIVLIIDALLKTILMYLLFILICKRLKLTHEKMEFSLMYSPWLLLIYIVNIVLISLLVKISSNMILLISVISIFIIINIYMLFLGSVALKLFMLERNKKPNGIALFSIILFPVGIISGLIFSVIYKNKIVKIY